MFCLLMCPQQKTAAQRDDCADQPTPSDHAYAAALPPPASNEENKHTFVLSQSAVPFFVNLHTVTGDRFAQLLSVHRSNAVTVMKEELIEDQSIVSTFKNIVASKGYGGSEPLLDLLVVTFLKSKQKQLLSDYGLAPSKASVALRTSLRQQQGKQSKGQLTSPEVATMKAHLSQNDYAAAVEQLSQALPDRQESMLDSLTVGNLKALLRHCKQPVGSDTKAQKILRLLDIMAKSKAGESTLLATENKVISMLVWNAASKV